MANLSPSLIKKLYYKEKLSTIEIGKKLRTTPWVVLKFMKRNDLPRRTFEEANEVAFARKPISYSLKQNLSKEEEKLRIAGIMLFLRFLRRICGVDEKRLRVLLYCYADQDLEILKNFWYKITGIDSKQFTKPYIRKDFLLEKSGKMKYGLVHIRYSDKKLLLQIESWIGEYLKICRI